jgi:hypothetical protein
MCVCCTSGLHPVLVTSTARAGRDRLGHVSTAELALKRGRRHGTWGPRSAVTSSPKLCPAPFRNHSCSFVFCQVEAGDSEYEVSALAWLLSQASETAANPSLLRVVEYAAKVLVRGMMTLDEARTPSSRFCRHVAPWPRVVHVCDFPQLHVLDEEHNSQYEVVQRQIFQSGSIFTICMNLGEAVRGWYRGSRIAHLCLKLVAAWCSLLLPSTSTPSPLPSPLMHDLRAGPCKTLDSACLLEHSATGLSCGPFVRARRPLPSATRSSR